MNSQELEKRLDYGEEWGFRRDTDTPEYLGWVLVSKQKPRPVSAFDPDEEPERYLEWKEWSEIVRQKPYVVAIVELRRDVHERDEDENTEDYRRADSYTFATLSEVEEFLGSQGYKLENIQHRAHLDAP